MSIKQVAKEAGVSIATVSRYLNSPEHVREKTRLKVQAAIEKTGFSRNALARNFRRGKTSLVMVVLPEVGDPFFSGVMRGIWRVARREGYSILISETQFNTEGFNEYADMVFSKQADGIILLASISPFMRDGGAGSSALERRPDGTVPPVVIGCETVTPQLSHFPSVRVDNVGAAREASRHLIGLGHRRIAFISGARDSLLTSDRERGYRGAMADAGLAVDDGWVLEGDLSIDGARRAVRELLAQRPRPTAIFCATDEMALGAMHEIRANGLAIPADISIVGFDDVRYAATASPPLTTVAQPAEEIGEHTMERLCRAMLGGDIGAEPEVVPHRLVLRSSTAAPPAE
ncbi:LacI family DNA-binding transcriptional regulator [Microbulbifer halophilus]|uniref:LacI family DNA-binding transcriptional regulator n=1 Tax=Microbulbifer halophilus TaxID=453963 RepID=A0ABW5E9Q3_9GAMM|nr:LacI family DNA-binding transcriptional regulator [Microbulbifer halophilus]MCW8125891.1 LacI family DNA-binding transcriptional regulator [Microbulbifer halophilus]